MKDKIKINGYDPEEVNNARRRLARAGYTVNEALSGLIVSFRQTSLSIRSNLKNFQDSCPPLRGIDHD